MPVISAASGVLVIRDAPADQPTTKAVDVTATPAPKKLGPLELHYLVKPRQNRPYRDEQETPRFPARYAAMRQDGTKIRKTSKWPGVPFDQYDERSDLAVYQKYLDSSSREWSGCGVAGCSTTFFSRAEAGIVARYGSAPKGRLLSRGGYDHAPRLSPDGTTIAYLQHIRDEKGRDQQADIVSFMSTSGEELGSLPRKSGTVDSSVAWSPDGGSVAVVRRRLEGKPSLPAVEIWSVGGVFQKRIARGRFSELTWSNDGTRLAAIGDIMERNDPGDLGHNLGDDVFVLPLDGEPKRITHMAPAAPLNTSGYFCGHTISEQLQVVRPMWSPDDEKIAFVTNHEHAGSGSESADIAVAAADGSKIQIVRHVPRTRCIDNYIEITDHVELLGWRHPDA